MAALPLFPTSISRVSEPFGKRIIINFQLCDLEKMSRNYVTIKICFDSPAEFILICSKKATRHLFFVASAMINAYILFI